MLLLKIKIESLNFHFTEALKHALRKNRFLYCMIQLNLVKVLFSLILRFILLEIQQFLFLKGDHPNLTQHFVFSMDDL